MRSLLIALVLLAAGPALADEAEAEPAIAEATAGGFGMIELLRDRTGGALVVVRKQSREVEVVRNGATTPATPGMALLAGDAVRCGTGIASIVTPDGGRIEIGERTQVRFDAGQLTQRLGDVVVETPGALAILVGTSRVDVEAGAARVTSTLRLDGLVSSLSGHVRITADAGERVLTPGQATEVGAGDGSVRALTPSELAAIDAARAPFVAPEATPLESPDRVHVLLAGGLGLVDRAEWGQGDLSVRVRIGGPVWVALGAGLTVRPAEELAGYTTVLALPARFGVRFIASLPRSAFLLGGADVTLLLGERCTSLEGCPRVFSVEPGGAVTLGAGVNIHRRIGLQFELGGGLYRRRLPPPGPGLDEISFPEFQMHVLVGVFLRI